MSRNRSIKKLLPKNILSAYSELDSFPPNKILVPMDTSKASMAAWRAASGWARQFKAVCEAAYIQEYPLVMDMGYAVEYPLEKMKKETLRFLRKKIGGGPHIHSIIGDAADGILDLAKTRRSDLIVMGTHARKGLSRFLMGSVAEAVIRKASAPVLVLRDEFPRVENILVPVNFTEYSTRGFEYAERAAKYFGASLTILHVAEGKKLTGNPWKKIEGLTRDYEASLENKKKLRRVVRTGDPVETILIEAKEHDLVILTAHRKSLLKDTVLGTTLERVLRHSPVPVLAVPENAPRSYGSINGHSKEAWI